MKPKPRPSNFSGRDALAYQQKAAAGDAAPSAHHVHKRNRADKGLEVVFDPVGYKSYVTGFHKRKAQRRKDAHEQIAVKEKKQRLEDRKHRRDDLAKKLQLEKYPDPEVALGAAVARSAAKVAAVDVFDCEGVTTTVTTIAMNSDEEEIKVGRRSDDEDGSRSDPEHEQPPSAVLRQSDSAVRRSNDEEASPSGSNGNISDSNGQQSDGSDGAFPQAEAASEANGATNTTPEQAAPGQAGGSGNNGSGVGVRRGGVIDRGIILRPSRTMKRKNARRKAEQVAAKQAKKGVPVPEKPGSRRSAKGATFNSSKRKRKGTAAGQARKGKGSDNKRKK